MKHFIYLFAALSILMAFQNCSEVAFDDGKAQFVAKNEGQVEDLQIDDQVNSNDPVTPKDDESNEDDQENDIDDGKSGGTPKNPPTQDDSNDDGKSGDSGSKDKSPDAQNGVQTDHICILEGPGDSLHVGVTNQTLIENGHIPNTVCMSSSACEDIVSIKLHVKSAKDSGVCNNNPHVIHMSDEQVKSIVDKM